MVLLLYMLAGALLRRLRIASPFKDYDADRPRFTSQSALEIAVAPSNQGRWTKFPQGASFGRLKRLGAAPK